MKAAVGHSADSPLSIEDVPVPELAAAQVPRLGFRVSETAGATAGVAAAVASERWRMPVRA